MKPKRKSGKSFSKASAKVNGKAPERTNPFEVKVNKQRHDVLGRKSKNDRGLPGVSRSKAIKKRNETLLQEYVLRNKSSAFVDKRIGEFDSEMNPDDKMAARLAQERKISQKKSVFSLNEEEELTHLGKSINDMERHDDPRSDDEDLYDKLGRDFADKTNFGGFLTKADPSSDSAKSRKEAIDQLIAESKKLKYERQVQKDENFELTERLDNDWKQFQGLLASSRLKKKPTEAEKESTDDYDVLVKQLRFAPRAGTATERVKTADEVAKEERKQLEKLELERKLRAKGIAERDSKKQWYFMSADDLDYNFYKQEPVTEDADMSGDEEEDAEEEGSGGDDEAEDKSASEGDDESGAESVEEIEQDVSGKEQAARQEDKSDDDDDDGYSDLESDDDGSLQKETPPVAKGKAKEAPKTSVIKTCKKLQSKAASEKEGGKPVSKAVPEKKESRPTCIVTIPESEEEFSKLMADNTADEKARFVGDMIKANQGGEKKLKKLEMLFVFLLQHLNDVADEDLELVDKLCPHIYALVQISPTTCGRFLLDVISEKEEDLQKATERRARFGISFPSFSTLVFLKIVGQCYSASDFSHIVATPAMLSASHMLTCCGLNGAADFLRGLFVTNVFLEYIAYSRRFSPEVFVFLERLLSHRELKLKKRADASGLLHEKLKLRLLGEEDVEMTDQLRVEIIYAGVKLVEKCAELSEGLPSFRELVDPLLKTLRKLEVSAYPPTVQSEVEKVISRLDRKVERKPLRPEKRPPPMKQLLEPRFSMKFDGRKHFEGGQKKAELKRLTYKHKKEMKGAMREVRRDNQFLARHILKDRIERDAERKEKVKQIYRELASQEGEYKALKRKKK
ncbi:putative nop14 [Ixodes scapularis]